MARRPKNFSALAFDALALVAGALLPLSLAPFDYYWVGVVSVVLLLVTVHVIVKVDLPLRSSSGRVVWRFYLYALGTYGVGASWIYVSVHVHGGASPLLASVLVSLFVAGVSLVTLIQGYLYVRLVAGNAVSVFVCFPALWLLKEWTLMWLLTGFPWLLIGYGHTDSVFAGYAPIAGVLGTGYLVVLFSTLLFLVISTLVRAGEQGQRLTRGLLVPVFLLFVLPLSGVFLGQLNWTGTTGRVATVSLVQANVDQNIKWRRDSVLPIIQTYRDLTAGEWGRDIILWPEAALTLFREQAGTVLESLDSTGKVAKSTLMLGIPDRDENGGFQNTAIALGLGSGTYIKRHLVPFGEYVPFESLLRGSIAFLDLPMSRNQPGPDLQPLLQADGIRVGMLICYEIVFPDLVRSGEPVDLLATISNDTWFGDSLGPKQHLQMAQMRALENGRSLIRATNNGLTAVIDHRGKVQKQLAPFTQGVLRGEVDIRAGATPYNVLGDYPALTGLLLLLAGHLAWRRRAGSGTSGVPESTISGDG